MLSHNYSFTKTSNGDTSIWPNEEIFAENEAYFEAKYKSCDKKPILILQKPQNICTTLEWFLLLSPGAYRVIVEWELFLILGERLSDAETDEVLADCMDKEDDEGFIPFERKSS